jgi:DNA-binding transcriptional MerR regulator
MKYPETIAEAKAENGRLMSIREVSALTGVPPHTLRFWEKQMPDVLAPERSPGGQRRYSRQTAERVRAIKRLSDEKKFSLAAIRSRLSGDNEVARPALDSGRRALAERAVDLIVDEVADMLKEKLLDLLEADTHGKTNSLNPAEPKPLPHEGGNGLELQRQTE